MESIEEADVILLYKGHIPMDETIIVVSGGYWDRQRLAAAPPLT